MAGIVQSLKGTVVDKKGEQVDVEALLGSGKFVGLYFSAHWCPPCRGFTPVLAEFYNKIKASDKAGQFEIIFVSCDRDQGSFDGYFKEMPWCAVAFNHQDTIKKVSEMAGVSGIPQFLIVDGAGNVHIKNARQDVTTKSATFLWE